MTGRSIVRITVWAGLPVPDHSVSLKHFHSSCKSCLMLSHYWSIFWHFAVSGPSEGRWHPDPAWVRAWGQEVEMSDLPQETSYVWNLENAETCCTFKLLRLPMADALTPSVSEEVLIWRGSLSMRFLRAPMKHTSWHTELVNMSSFSYTSVLAVFWWMDFLHTQGSLFSRQLK